MGGHRPGRGGPDVGAAASAPRRVADDPPLGGPGRGASAGRGADRDEDQLFRFKKWTRSSEQVPLPYRLEDEFMFSGVPIINIEMINDKVIEIHFRDTPDPDYEELIPVWSDEQQVVDILSKMGYTFIEALDDSNGFLTTYRLGFMVK